MILAGPEAAAATGTSPQAIASSSAFRTFARLGRDGDLVAGEKPRQFFPPVAGNDVDAAPDAGRRSPHDIGLGPGAEQGDPQLAVPVE